MRCCITSLAYMKPVLFACKKGRKNRDNKPGHMFHVSLSREEKNFQNCVVRVVYRKRRADDRVTTQLTIVAGRSFVGDL